MGTAEKRALGNLPDKLLTDCALGNKLLPETKERWRLAGWGTLPQPGPSAYHGALSSLDHECPTALGVLATCTHLLYLLIKM